MSNLFQKILIKPFCINSSRELYYRTESMSGTRTDGDVLVVYRNAIVDFGTYFNALSCTKIDKYTDIKRIGLSLDIKGKAEITIYHSMIMYGQVYKNVLGKVILKSTESHKTLKAGTFNLPKGGCLSFELRAIKEDVTVHGGMWTGDCPSDKREINIAIVFTAYKREQYIKANLNRIINLHDENIYTYVVDNGKTLDLPESEQYKVIQNKNIGGAGGFARAMMQLADEKEDKRFTHFILMDDDVDLDPRLLQRLMYFLEYIKPEYRDAFVGGAMFRNDIPYFQVESGACRDGIFINGYGYGMDMRDPYNCLKNEMFRQEDYNAWWFCCIPVSYLRDDNLPLPLFFQWDDVDYGIRNKAHLILINGICTWHDCFDSKRSALQVYYSTRNPLIVDACHSGRISKVKFLKIMDNLVRDQIYMYRYHEVMAYLKGVEDFLKGPDWLCSINQEAYNKEILSLNKCLEHLDVDYDWYRLCCTIEDCDFLHKLVRVITFNGMLLPANRRIIIPLYANRPVQTYRATEVLYYNELNGKGYRVKKNFHEMWKCFREYLKVRKLVKKKYNKVGEEYRKAYPYMTSRESWEKILDIK